MGQTTTGSAHLNGTTFYYQMAGTGYHLVLVHAGIADSRMWDDQFAVFAQYYTTVRYDMRGYGKTPMVAGSFSHRQDLRDLLAFLGIERAFLLGCSNGGRVIIDFALEYPEVVAALVLVCSGVSGNPLQGQPPPQWDELVEAYKQGDLKRTAELEAEIWVNGPQRTSDQVDPLIRERVLEMDLIALQNEAAGLGEEQPLEPPAAGRLSEIRVPTLVIVGALDQPDEVATADLLVEGIASAKKVVVPDAAHLPNMEHPDQFNRIVLDFLREL